MKSPREILLEQQQNYSPQLDAIRRQVIDQELGEGQRSVLDAIRSWWSMNRIVWASFAAAWVAIIALNVAAGNSGHSQVVVREETESSDVRVRWQDYRAELAILLLEETSTDDSSAEVIDNIPGPRSAAPGSRQFSQLRSMNYA